MYHLVIVRPCFSFVLRFRSIVDRIRETEWITSRRVGVRITRRNNVWLIAGAEIAVSIESDSSVLIFFIWIELISFAFGFLFSRWRSLQAYYCNVIYFDLCVVTNIIIRIFKGFLNVRIRNYYTLQISLQLLLLKDSFSAVTLKFLR